MQRTGKSFLSVFFKVKFEAKTYHSITLCLRDLKVSNSGCTVNHVVKQEW